VVQRYEGLSAKLHFWKANCSVVVVFRLVVFRPFISEVVVAKVKSSDEDGIRRTFPFLDSKHLLTRRPVTMGFFDDIYIPTAYLPQPSALFVLIPPF
jgi:DNA-directed RNA polymerase subunit E'/Rpb7